MATEDKTHEFLRTNTDTIFEISRDIQSVGVRKIGKTDNDFGIQVICNTRDAYLACTSIFGNIYVDDNHPLSSTNLEFKAIGYRIIQRTKSKAVNSTPQP